MTDKKVTPETIALRTFWDGNKTPLDLYNKLHLKGSKWRFGIFSRFLKLNPTECIRYVNTKDALKGDFEMLAFLELSLTDEWYNYLTHAEYDVPEAQAV